jgi:murein DD-endopeptidase MepM/ murein hydrolase activator NlpD
MVARIARCGWDGRNELLAVVCLSLFATGCASIPLLPASSTPAPAPIVHSDDDDYSELIAQMRADLNRHTSRETARKPTIAPSTQTAKGRDREFSDRARALFAPLSQTGLRMPVVGVSTTELEDSWHAPRDGGARQHKGIDIFAHRGTEVVAVTDGIVSYIGDQPKGGHCLWLTTENGKSFYYAHLDHWASGIYEGMEVQSGDLLGYVGNTGNAVSTPPHLHFQVNENDETVNPYPILTHAIPTKTAHVHVELGGGFGTH